MPLTRPLCGPCRIRDLPPGLESVHHLLAILRGREEMTPRNLFAAFLSRWCCTWTSRTWPSWSTAATNSGVGHG